jgi:hypothetical protein
MGIAYRCIRTAGLTVTVWDGPVTPEDWRSLIAAQDDDPEWPTERLLGVFETARGFRAFDDKVVAEMINTYRPRAERLHGAKSAVVAQQELSGTTDIPRALQGTGVRVIAFGDLRPACMWLDVEFEHTQSVIDQLRTEIRRREERSGDRN